MVSARIRSSCWTFFVLGVLVLASPALALKDAISDTGGDGALTEEQVKGTALDLLAHMNEFYGVSESEYIVKVCNSCGFKISFHLVVGKHWFNSGEIRPGTCRQLPLSSQATDVLVQIQVEEFPGHGRQLPWFDLQADGNKCFRVWGTPLNVGVEKTVCKGVPDTDAPGPWPGHRRHD